MCVCVCAHEHACMHVSLCIASRTKHRQVGPSDHKTGQDGMYNCAKHNTSHPFLLVSPYRERFTLPCVIFLQSIWNMVLPYTFVYRIGRLLPSPGCYFHQGMYSPLFLPLGTMPGIFRRHKYVLSEPMQIRRASTRWEGRTDSPWSQGTQISRVLYLQK